jgi:hypothetical protein
VLSANVHQIVFVSSEPEIARVAARWLPFKSSLRFAYHANDEPGPGFMQAAEPRLGLLDSDFEMMLESKA